MAGKTVRSEDWSQTETESAALPLTTTREAVAGYQAKWAELTGSRQSGGQESASAAPVYRDAADASFANVSQPENIIGVDDRVRVDSVTSAPWSRICALNIRGANNSYVGTGWLIGKRTIVTAGHCVFLHDDGGTAGFPKSVEVIPAIAGDSRPFGAVTATKFRAVDEWVKGRDTNYDYGVIILDKDVGSAVGSWFTYASLDDGQLRGSQANISGYPFDKIRDNNGQRYQYFHARPISKVDEYKIYYDVDTFGGQSGSPVWLNFQGRRIAVGIHTTGAASGNSGTRIRADVFKQLQAWKREAEGQ